MKTSMSIQTSRKGVTVSKMESLGNGVWVTVDIGCIKLVTGLDTVIHLDPKNFNKLKRYVEENTVVRGEGGEYERFVIIGETHENIDESRD